MSGHPTLPDDEREAIRVRFLQMIGPATGHEIAVLARRLDVTTHTLRKFRQFYNGELSSSLACRIVLEFPELGRDLSCPCCHPPFPPR